ALDAALSGAPGARSASAVSTAVDASSLPTAVDASYSGSPAAATLAGAGAGPGEGAGGGYAGLIDQAATQNGLEPAVLHGLIEQESGFDANATSSAGALGLTQLMPGTAASLGVTEP